MKQTSPTSILIAAIVWFHIVSHMAIFVMDYTQVVPLVDFVTRPDGSPSDPKHLEPLELVYVGVTSMSFGTVAFAYLFAALGLFQTSLRSAAALSAAFHAAWVGHMWWFWEAWDRNMHPDGSMTPRFFLMSHCVWTVLSVVVLVLTGGEGREDGRPMGKKRT